MRTADWAMIGGATVGVSVIGYALWDYQQQQQKQKWDPKPMEEPRSAGRFGQAFPVNEQDYKTAAKKQITLEELEWNIKDRERQYQQYIQEHKKS